MKTLLLLFILCIANLALCAEQIGSLFASSGQVTAKAQNQEERDLQPESPIFLGDLILVGVDSSAQIHFTDGAILDLIADTAYQITAYKYRKLLAKDQYSAELLKGGFRTLSGSIAKKNPSQYEVKTPTSTIGLRGTIITARIVGSSVFYGCEFGMAIVSNAAGSTLIGQKAPSQFCITTSTAVRPENLKTTPPELDRALFIVPPGAVSIDQAQQSKAAASNKPSSAPQEAAAKPQTGSSPSEAPSQKGAAPSSGISEADSSSPQWKIQQTGGSGVSVSSGC